MSFFSVIDTAATGLSAQRIRINVISSNVANAKTTRTEEGGPYRKKNVIFEQVLHGQHKGGVKVQKILPDFKPPMLVYEPSHPDANEEGYVAYPNINPIEELVNMLEASRSYEANVTIVNTAKQLAQQAIGIGQR
ncbi:MAG: flagellar basal body rod protein FlgC [Deferribacteraceae bacterium]|jgi:flagellar basal-body rod protein FlgC|nr:flagellar basal body rod protein FlgC [Deferribacteraceae bacterium]